MSEIRMDIGARPTLEWVDKTLIDVDHNYQREVDGRSVEKISDGAEFGRKVAVRVPRWLALDRGLIATPDLDQGALF